MDVSIDSKEFARIIGRASSAAPTKATMAVLGTILISVDGDTVHATGTDLVVTSSASCACRTESHGEWAVPATKLMHIAKTLNGTVRLRVKDDTANVSCGRSKFKLPAFPGDQFPNCERAENVRASWADIAAGELGAAIGRSIYSMDATEGRPTYGLRFDGMAADGELAIVGTRSSSLAMDRLAASVGEAFTVAPRAALEIKKLCGGDGVMRIAFDGSRAWFSRGGESVSTVAVDGAYVPWAKVVPIDDGARTASMSSDALVASLRRASVALPNPESMCRLTITAGTLSVSAVSDSGEASDAFDVVADFDAEVGISVGRLTEAAASMPADEVRMSFGGPLDPVVLRCDRAMAVVMPMRLP